MGPCSSAWRRGAPSVALLPSARSAWCGAAPKNSGEQHPASAWASQGSADTATGPGRPLCDAPHPTVSSASLCHLWGLIRSRAQRCPSWARGPAVPDPASWADCTALPWPDPVTTEVPGWPGLRAAPSQSPPALHSRWGQVGRALEGQAPVLTALASPLAPRPPGALGRGTVWHNSPLAVLAGKVG